MRAAVFAYSRRGCDTARRIRACLADSEVRCYAVRRLEEQNFMPIPASAQSCYGAEFQDSDALIFVGAAGIAVRQIAPYVRDKRTDPAVIVVDELGKFVIPLLSGHIGGANELAQRLAGHLSAVPVITTATDINGKFSVDAWAARQGFAISSMDAAKLVSAEILERPVPLCSDFPVVTDLPAGVTAADGGKLGICISWEKKEPFQQTLRLIPRVLHLGIGCRRGTSAEAIRQAVDEVLMTNRIDPQAIKCAASIDLKADEDGLLAYCLENRWPVTFYSAQELLAVQGEFSVSPFVQRVTDVDCVCERAACIGADRLIVKKTARSGVTVAVAAEKLEVRFE